MPAIHVAAGPTFRQATDDYASRLVLAQPLLHLKHGAAEGADLAVAVHANFGRVIEQNFAMASPLQVARWLDTVETRSLTTLAQAYINATEHRGRGALALDILAHRLDSARLARLATHFGYQRVRAALVRTAPAHLMAFMALADRSAAGPVAGEMNLHRHSHSACDAPPNLGVFLDHSTEQIYLCFRTAPLGATSAAAALFQAGVMVGTALPTARNPGARIGAYLSLGAQLFPPAVWRPWVPRASAWLQAFLRAACRWPALPDEERLARLQREGCIDVFQLPMSLQSALAHGGGDHRCTGAWAACQQDSRFALELP